MLVPCRSESLTLGLGERLPFDDLQFCDGEWLSEEIIGILERVLVRDQFAHQFAAVLDDERLERLLNWNWHNASLRTQC